MIPFYAALLVLLGWAYSRLVKDRKNSKFEIVMRGYDRQEVDEYVERLIKTPDLPMPEFSLTMRGYRKEQVDSYIQENRMRVHDA